MKDYRGDVDCFRYVYLALHIVNGRKFMKRKSLVIVEKKKQWQ